jgi:hypothetical protein
VTVDDDLDDLDDLAAPNCPVDLVPMVAAGDERPRWVCPVCGLARV